MKRHITKAQLEEISKEQQDYIQDIILGVDIRMGMYFGMDIGQMIEFLGEDIFFIEWVLPKRRSRIGMIDKVFEESELVDALWEAVKYKLNKEECCKEINCLNNDL